MMGGLNEGIPVKTNGKQHCCPLCHLLHHCALLLVVLLLVLLRAAACHATARYHQSHHHHCLVSCCCGRTAVCHAVACRVGPSCHHRHMCHIATVRCCTSDCGMLLPVVLLLQLRVTLPSCCCQTICITKRLSKVQ